MEAMEIMEWRPIFAMTRKRDSVIGEHKLDRKPINKETDVVVV